MSQDINEKKCKTCGKTITVLHPTRWAYKKTKGTNQEMYFCSWRCLREDETQQKGKKGMQRITREQKERAVDIAISGGDPIKYLGECGSKDPKWCWFYIKKKLAEVNPEKHAKIPEMKRGRKAGISPQKKAKKPQPEGVTVKKIQKAGKNQLHFEHTGEPLGKVEEIDDSDGGVTVRIKTVKKASDLPVPMPLDGGEWTKAQALTKDEHAEAHMGTHTVVIKEARLPEMPKLLKIAGLESEALKNSSWVRTGEMIVLNNGSEMSLSLAPNEWRGLAKEIELMLMQFGA